MTTENHHNKLQTDPILLLVDILENPNNWRFHKDTKIWFHRNGIWRVLTRQYQKHVKIRCPIYAYYSGYYWYQLIWRDNKKRASKWYLIHRIIYELFYEPIKQNNVINHIDGNKINNSIINLEQCTQRENILAWHKRKREQHE